MAIKKNCSNHLITERWDRVEYIIDHIGIGEVIAEREWRDTKGTPCIRQLTTTGVIIVRDVSKTKVVTMWTANILQVKAMYFGKIPNWMYKIVVKNEKIMKDFHG